MARVFVSGAFDDLRSQGIRFLEAAAGLGRLSLLLWPDALVERLTGSPPRFSLAERRYLLEALRPVDRVLVLSDAAEGDALPNLPEPAAGLGRESGDEQVFWVSGADFGPLPERDSAAKREAAAKAKIAYRAISAGELKGFAYVCPALDGPRTPGLPRVVVTGCYDWFHSGHARFFEEAAAFGELNVVLGSDANVRLLKGEGHPLLPETERRYVVGSLRSVTRALVATGSGWLDAEPEIRELGIERYVVNEDGDRPEKRRFCEAEGIEYIVLKRRPKEGLPRRASTDLRGF